MTDDKHSTPQKNKQPVVGNPLLSLDEPTDSLYGDEIETALELKDSDDSLNWLDEDKTDLPLQLLEEPEPLSLPDSELKSLPPESIAPAPHEFHAESLPPSMLNTLPPDSVVPLHAMDSPATVKSKSRLSSPPPVPAAVRAPGNSGAGKRPMPPKSSKTPGSRVSSNAPPTGPYRISMPPPPMETTGKTPYFGLKITGSLLGQILVDNGFLTEAQRDYCLRLQTQSGNFFRLGELAVKQEFISEENLALCIKAQQVYVQGVKKEQSRMLRLPEEVAQAKLAADAPNASVIQNWLGSALKHGASDMHVMTGQPLVLRHMGKLVRSKQSPLSANRTAEVLESIMTDAEKEEFAFSHSILKCLQIKGLGRARANVFRHMSGVNGIFRLIPQQPPSLVSLNLPSKLAKFTTYSQGLVLVTGPTGCGKTTTMAALVDIINREHQSHIITVERPVEYIHRNMRSVVSQREVGHHTEGYASALRAALRQDPDVIVIGEMNDVHTARLAISAAETGHLVFATLHTDNAVRTVNRVLDIFPPDEQDQIRSMLSESLRGVICQRLVQRDAEPGLIPVMELLFTTPAMRNLIREAKVYQLPNAIRMSADIGNRTFADYAKSLLEKKEISEATYEQFCREET
ncbi:MAG: PilT/PilU family type 4a pilus ATPase [Deltaproteobacteria bacterium]|nr:PilT/PilU family type 4a pilus ATPase [Deltaproteobacteria bacterium]